MSTGNDWKFGYLEQFPGPPENILSTDDGFAGNFALLKTAGKREGEWHEAQNQNPGRQDQTQPQRHGSWDHTLILRRQDRRASCGDGWDHDSCGFDEGAMSLQFCGQLPSADARKAQDFGQRLSQQTGGQNSMRLLRGKENPMKLKTRIKAGRPNPNHNIIVR
jgi:hypothetical protein